MSEQWGLINCTSVIKTLVLTSRLNYLDGHDNIRLIMSSTCRLTKATTYNNKNLLHQTLCIVYLRYTFFFWLKHFSFSLFRHTSCMLRQMSQNFINHCILKTFYISVINYSVINKKYKACMVWVSAHDLKPLILVWKKGMECVGELF